MANGPVHRAVGIASGGGLAWHRARSQPAPHVVAETVGGVVGGLVGARLPDLIDPPIHPRHRGIGHGIVPVALGASLAFLRLDGWQESLRSEADRRAQLRRGSSSVLGSALHWLVEIFCRFASGALAGFVGGYLSHVALDGFTPAGLPLVL